MAQDAVQRPLNLWFLVPLAVALILLVAGVLFGLSRLVSSSQRHLASIGLSDIEIIGTRIPCFGFFDFGVNFEYYYGVPRRSEELRLCHNVFDGKWTLYKWSNGALEPRTR